MIQHRPFASLGQTQIAWLNAKHHFSFGYYREPSRDHWGALRVWNDDVIAPHKGFDPHPHDNMEIITYVQKGAISHKDSLGNEGRTKAGDVQVMSAGTGIVHSEYNHEDEHTHIFQIWIMPDSHNKPPSWGTRKFPEADRSGRFIVLASGLDADNDALPIRAAARVLGANLTAGTETTYKFDGLDRYGYMVPAKGCIDVNGTIVNARDGVAISKESIIHIKALEDSEIVLVDASAL